MTTRSEPPDSGVPAANRKERVSFDFKVASRKIGLTAGSHRRVDDVDIDAQIHWPLLVDPSHPLLNLLDDALDSDFGVVDVPAVDKLEAGGDVVLEVLRALRVEHGEELVRLRRHFLRELSKTYCESRSNSSVDGTFGSQETFLVRFPELGRTANRQVLAEVSFRREKALTKVPWLICDWGVEDPG